MDLLIEIIIAVITGGITLIGVLMTNNSKQAVMENKIETLTREVREHNNFAMRMPLVEERIKSVNHRLDDLSDEVKALTKGGEDK